jgi:hypothetical protein
MISRAQILLSTASEETQSYSGDRFDSWHESIAADELLAKVELLQEAVTQLQAIE